VATDPWYVQGQGQGTTEVGQGAGQTNYNTLVNGWIAAYAVVTTHDNWINYNIMQPPAGTFSAPYARYAFSAAGAGTLALPGEVGGQNNLYTIDGTDSASMDLAGFRVHTNARLDLAIDLGGWMTRVTSTGTPFAGIDTRKAEVWSGAAGPYQLRNQYKLKFKGKYLQYVSAADPAQDAAGTAYTSPSSGTATAYNAWTDWSAAADTVVNDSGWLEPVTTYVDPWTGLGTPATSAPLNGTPLALINLVVERGQAAGTPGGDDPEDLCPEAPEMWIASRVLRRGLQDVAGNYRSDVLITMTYREADTQWVPASWTFTGP
jgi:hypothetical protein